MGNGSQQSRNTQQSRRSQSNSERIEQPSERELADLRDLAEREMNYDLAHRAEKRSTGNAGRSS